MLRSPWLWVTIVLIVAGIALTTALEVFVWLAAALGVAVLLILGAFLHAAYAVGSVDPPSLPRLESASDENLVPLIYDCDLTMGRPFRNVGDGIALLYLIGEPRIDLRAVTTTYGNAPSAVTARTTQRLLRALGLHHLTVARGASDPDADASENEAARYLVHAVNAQPGEIVLLATGPLTNLRHASMLDPDFFEKLRSLYLAGGMTGELTWNERRVVERNFSADPEAAYEAIQPYCPTTVAPAEAGLTAIFRSPQFAALEALGGPVPRMIARRIRLWFALMRLWFRDDGFPMWESVAALAIVHPEVFRFQRAHLPTTIEDLRTGRLVVDPQRVGPVRLIDAVREHEAFVSIHFAAWQRLNRIVKESDTRSAASDGLAGQSVNNHLGPCRETSDGAGENSP